MNGQQLWCPQPLEVHPDDNRSVTCDLDEHRKNVQIVEMYLCQCVIVCANFQKSKSTKSRIGVKLSKLLNKKLLMKIEEKSLTKIAVPIL